jgi:hypothetical protein
MVRVGNDKKPKIQPKQTPLKERNGKKGKEKWLEMVHVVVAAFRNDGALSEYA